MKLIILTLITISSLFAGKLILTGTVISNNQKMIPTRYMGYIKKVNFEIGDRVEREDILFELESAEFDMMESQADLALAHARLMLETFQSRSYRAKKDKENLEKNKKSSSKQSFDLKQQDIQ